MEGVEQIYDHRRAVLRTNGSQSLCQKVKEHNVWLAVTGRRSRTRTKQKRIIFLEFLEGVVS